MNRKNDARREIAARAGPAHEREVARALVEARGRARERNRRRMSVAKNDGVPVLIDGGARWMVRDVADSFDLAVKVVLPELVARCPAGAYPLRSHLSKDVRGARTYVQVVFQVAGKPLERER
jgi:hypothetical protein